MKRKEGIIPLLILLLFLGGCANRTLRERAYRDPITYSFEAYTPETRPEDDPFNQLLTGIKTTSHQIQNWEKKHFW